MIRVGYAVCHAFVTFFLATSAFQFFHEQWAFWLVVGVGFVHYAITVFLDSGHDPEV